eukprot:7980962-Karenia_brevis.AAC.1
MMICKELQRPMDSNMKPIGKPEAGPKLGDVKKKWPSELLEANGEANAEWAKQQNGPSSSKSEGPLWEGVHSETWGNKIKIDQRVDRTLLLSVYEQGKQVRQVCCWDFGELPEPQPKR